MNGLFQDVVNPACFSEVVGQVPMSSAEDVDRSLEQAQGAFQTWSRTTPAERANRLLDAARDLRSVSAELATLFVRENGKPLREAEIDIRRSIELLETVATDLPEWWKPSIIDTRQHISARRRARGVTAVISPWNSPVLLSFKRFVPAVATGNTVVLKPSSYCPLTISRCVDVIDKHLPPGVLSVVTGSGAVVGEKLATDERVRTIAFTGSTETGRRIMELASRSVKKVFMELGGNDPALVLADAQLDKAAVERMTNAVLRATGQVCIAIKRIYVHESKHEELVEKLTESFDRVVVGDGLAPETTMGPLNNKAQFDFVAGLLERCKAQGRAVLTKGMKLAEESWKRGYFMLPSIVVDAGDEDETVRCEQFGPVIPVIRFKDEDEAIAQANDTSYGLRASVWTRRRERAVELADRLEAGAVFWNAHGIFQDLHIEFPGIKQSGFSRESRSAAMDHYVDTYGFAE
jgi:acyl-CoA reductase-like NAD-dependent aldehyde dehydrogenase